MATDPSIPAGHEEAHSVVVPPSALDHLDDIARNCDRRRLFVFLDFDGTLTPIVDRAEASDARGVGRAEGAPTRGGD